MKAGTKGWYKEVVTGDENAYFAELSRCRSESLPLRQLSRRTIEAGFIAPREKELLELADVCEEVANKFEDRMTAG